MMPGMTDEKTRRNARRTVIVLTIILAVVTLRILGEDLRNPQSWFDLVGAGIVSAILFQITAKPHD
jgi:cell division protein FtsW (lipid II flippase)